MTMKWFDNLKELFTRATTVKHPLDLSVDQQWANIERHIAQENASEKQRLENQYPAGWFKLIGQRGGVELAHWCPSCKQLTTGKTAIHCSGRKRESRPEGWRTLFCSTAFYRI